MPYESHTGSLTSSDVLNGTLTEEHSVKGRLSTTTVALFNHDYNALYEDTMPKINNVTLKGNKISSELHVQHEMDVISYQDIDDILFG